MFAKILIIFIFFAITVSIGVYCRKHTTNVNDYVLAGRNLGPWMSAFTYGTTYFSAVIFVGYAGQFGWGFGTAVVWIGIGNALIGSLLAWVVLGRRTRVMTNHLDSATMPDFFAKRYNSDVLKVVVSALIFIFLVPYSASVYKGIASISKVMLSDAISDKLWLVIIAVVAMLILVFGGYVVQARADFVQGIMMVIGMVALLIFIVRSSQVGGPAGIIEYVKSDIGLPTLKGPQWIALISLVLMTSFGTWGLPHMIQKFFGIKSDKQAKMGTVISTLFCLLIAGGGYFIGSLVFKILTPDTIAGLKAQYPLNFKDYLVPTILKTVQLPDILVGLTLVMLIAASVTTLCSISLTASSVFSLDFIKSTFKKNMGDKSAANMTKIIGVAFIIVSYIVANTKTPILDMMAYSWGIISGSFLAPYALALFWKGPTRQAPGRAFWSASSLRCRPR